MKIPRRILTVKITFPHQETGTLVINGTTGFPIRFQGHKNVLQIQNEAQITLIGLRPDVRQRLLTAFTAWNYRKTPTGNYATVEVFAGYASESDTSEGSRIFVGDVVVCDVTGELPNLEINITAYTRQRDRSDLTPGSIPSKGSFKSIVTAIGKAAGMAVDCQTSYDSQIIDNFGVFQVNPTGEPWRYSVQAAIVGLGGLAPDTVAVWVDDDKLIARDIASAVAGDVPIISTFVGQSPSWTEWGVTFVTLFTPRLRLAGGCRLESVTMPSINGEYVISQLDYNLTSREKPFYVTVHASPPASSASGS